jgi:radical SAM protein with 4Fe4S-binding SPASM domain
MPTDLLAESLRQFVGLRDSLRIRRMWVQLTGGEPLLHPEWAGLLALVSSMFSTRMLTNGTLIDADAARLLAQHCESVQVSFDGCRQEHDSWRGEGSFDVAMAGLLALESAGVTRTARMTVARNNQHCVERLLDELGPHIHGFNVSRIVPVNGLVPEQPDRDAYRRIIYRLYGAHFADSRVRLRDPFFGVLMKVDYQDCRFFGCSAGISNLCVTETGDIYPCRRLPIPLGNVGTTSLREVYENHPLVVALRERRLSGKCGGCEDRLICGGSRCIAYALTGDPLAEDPGCIYLGNG